MKQTRIIVCIIILSICAIACKNNSPKVQSENSVAEFHFFTESEPIYVLKNQPDTLVEDISGNDSNYLKTEIKTLAKFLYYEGGSKIHQSKFKVIDNSLHQFLNDTISVQYYFYKMPTEKLDTVSLTLYRTKKEGIYVCPDYDGAKGIQPINK